jgi:1,4-dihydroxy-6-naphthoate synthase
MTCVKPLSLGFSPCPNDTFIFCRLIEGMRHEQLPLFQNPFLEDVETLNQWAFAARLDVTKLSFHAVAHLLDSYCILSAGSALGRGCGPLLVCRENTSLAALKRGTVAIPGQYTTAALLFKMFLPEQRHGVEMRFEQIMEAVEAGEVDGGVIIHESRFTYQHHGLICLQDLGQWWEDRFDLPIPLGCIATRRDLGDELIAAVNDRIRASLLWARRNPDRCYDYIKQYAQESEDAVIEQHIALYVNDFSMDLGMEGRSAVETFIEQGRMRGVLPASDGALFCSGERD